jgi:hypothetical protein
LQPPLFWFFLWTDLKAQKREWEFDKMLRLEKQKQRELDSIMVHLEKKWEIKLSYGRWFFSDNSRSKTEDLFTLPRSMNLWQLTGSWHFSENLSADISIGFQLTKDVPSPNINDILNGNDIKIEGSGGIFLPIDLGVKYYFTKKRFRPLVGFSVGSVSANFKYTIAEGNISNGFSSTDHELNDRARFGKFYTGFDHRLGKNTSFSLNLLYYSSGTFKEPIGGYSRYQGFVVNAGFSLIL